VNNDNVRSTSGRGGRRGRQPRKSPIRDETISNQGNNTPVSTSTSQQNSPAESFSKNSAHTERENVQPKRYSSQRRNAGSGGATPDIPSSRPSNKEPLANDSNQIRPTLPASSVGETTEIQPKRYSSQRLLQSLSTASNIPTSPSTTPSNPTSTISSPFAGYTPSSPAKPFRNQESTRPEDSNNTQQKRETVELLGSYPTQTYPPVYAPDPSYLMSVPHMYPQYHNNYYGRNPAIPYIVPPYSGYPQNPYYDPQLYYSQLASQPPYRGRRPRDSSSSIPPPWDQERPYLPRKNIYENKYNNQRPPQWVPKNRIEPQKNTTSNTRYSKSNRARDHKEIKGSPSRDLETLAALELENLKLQEEESLQSEQLTQNLTSNHTDT
jgi:hypothetical protein